MSRLGAAKKHNDAREDAAHWKRQRKAAKRESDAQRTAEGRYWLKLRHDHGRGLWDRIERMNYHSTTPTRWAGGGAVEIDGVVHLVTLVEPSTVSFLPELEPRWRQRLAARRERPMLDVLTLLTRIWRQVSRRHPETGSGGHAARSDAGHPTTSGPSPSQADGGGR